MKEGEGGAEWMDFKNGGSEECWFQSYYNLAMKLLQIDELSGITNLSVIPVLAAPLSASASSCLFNLHLLRVFQLQSLQLFNDTRATGDTQTKQQ